MELREEIRRAVIESGGWDSNNPADLDSLADAILALPELVEMQRVKKLVDQAVANALNGSDERGVQLNKGA